MLLLAGCKDKAVSLPITTPDCSVTGAGDLRPAPSAIFIFAGQSNMHGLGETKAVSPEYQAAVPNVLVWVRDHWETYKPEWHFGPELAFMHQWSKDHPTETVGIIKCAIGGTSMADWQPNWTARAAGNPQFGSLYQLLLDIYNTAGRLPVNAIIWDQGEFDAGGYSFASQYASRFNAFIRSLRADVAGMGIIPFVFGQTQYPGSLYISAIQDAQFDVSQANQSVCESMTGDFPLLADRLHFSSEGQLMLGTSLYTAFKGC